MGKKTLSKSRSISISAEAERATIETGSAVTKDYGWSRVTGISRQGGPSTSPPARSLACACVTRVRIRPFSGLNTSCPQFLHSQELLPRIHRCVPIPHRFVGTHSSLRPLSSRSVTDLSTQKGATWSGAPARDLGGFPVRLPDQLAKDNCCRATI